MKRCALILLAGGVVPVHAEPVPITGQLAQRVIVELSWKVPVDLDLFVTDPEGETVYFANRKARTGLAMGEEADCRTIAAGSAPYRETAIITAARPGRYRVSVDFLKDCGTIALQADFGVRLLEATNGNELARSRSQVRHRVLEPVAWEFVIQ